MNFKIIWVWFHFCFSLVLVLFFLHGLFLLVHETEVSVFSNFLSFFFGVKDPGMRQGNSDCHVVLSVQHRGLQKGTIFHKVLRASTALRRTAILLWLLLFTLLFCYQSKHELPGESCFPSAATWAENIANFAFYETRLFKQLESWS